ncbi:iron-containing alcohol dehydrogenase [Clostridium sp. JNZ X4-2]
MTKILLVTDKKILEIGYAEKAVDGIVGLGGGSTLDSAKAIAAVIPNGDAVRKLCKEIQIPSFKEQGFTKEQILAAKPMIYKEPLCMSFGGTITEQDVVTTLEMLYDDYQ